MNLLTEPVFRVETSGGMEMMSLPQLLSALGEDRVESLPGLQRHQEDPFHIFLCYLAGGVLAREGAADPVKSEDFWRDGIRRLTGLDDDSAWTLVVEDVTKPAFMQAPAPTEEFFKKKYKPKANTPDEIDVLVKTKNHDIKMIKVRESDAEDWAYSLVNAQTMNGFSGRSNYGIARMNGGYGSRPCLGLLFNDRYGYRWRGEVNKLLEYRSELFLPPWRYKADGLLLTWLPAWDGQSTLALDMLDPFFIEISRSLRLVGDGGQIHVKQAPTDKARIEAEEQKGVLGDPWIPVNVQKGTALTVSANGFTPSLLRDLIFEKDFIPSYMQKFDKDSSGSACFLYASTLVRGQGKTDGFHSANIRIPATANKLMFGGGAALDSLADLSKDALSDTSAIQNKALGSALFSLMEGGPDSPDFGKREIGSWVSKHKKLFAGSWEDEYFPWLWRSVDRDKESSLREWRMSLFKAGKAVLENATQSCPTRSGRLYKGKVASENIFYGSVYKLFPDLKEVLNEHRGN